MKVIIIEWNNTDPSVVRVPDDVSSEEAVHRLTKNWDDWEWGHHTGITVRSVSELPQ